MRLAALLLLLAGCAPKQVVLPRFPALAIQAKAPKKPRAVLAADSIQLLDKVRFDKGKATLSPESYVLLDEVAEILHTNQNILVLAVEGHTDSSGSRAGNRRLSKARARSVCNYLIERAGIDKSRLRPLGFGSKKPIADNETEEGREKNRRVEFNIEKRADASTTEAP